MSAAVILALVGAVVGLGYAGWAVTLRRGVYADIDKDGPTAVSEDDADTSDLINAIGIWVAGALIGLAFVLLVASMITARRSRNGLGIAAVVIVVLGGAVAAWSGLLVAGVDDSTEAQDGVTWYLVLGSAFAAMAIGLILGLLGLRRPATPAPAGPSSAPFPPAPYGGQQSPYGQQPAAGPYSGSGGQPYGGQGGNPYAR